MLGVPETATSKEIRAAYRKVALKLHPDVNKAPDAKERFIECKMAYDTLSDDVQRSTYDRKRRSWNGSGSGASSVGADFGKDWDSFSAYTRFVFVLCKFIVKYTPTTIESMYRYVPCFKSVFSTCT